MFFLYKKKFRISTVETMGAKLSELKPVPLIKKCYTERGIWGPNFSVNLQDMLSNLFQVRYTF